MIKTERLTLKPYSDEDQNKMIELLMNEEIKKTYMIPDFDTTEDAILMFKKLQRFSNSEDHYELGVYKDNELIGFINDVEIEGHKIEIGYVIEPKFQGRGYATEVLTTVINDLFRRGFKEIIAGTFQSNKASYRVMENCGMKRIDKEDDITYQGKIQHCIYYCIRKK